MKTVEIPSDVVLKNVSDKELMCMEEFLLGAIRQHKPFGCWPGLRQAGKIADVIEAANGAIELEDADYAELRAAVKAAQWHPIVAPQLLPFYKAMGFE